MSGRQYLYSFALVAVAAFGAFFFKPFEQQPAKAYEGPKWAYHVVQLDSSQCTPEGLNGTLNDLGQFGWELVNYAQTPEESSLLVQLGSTSYGKEVNPPIADSFTGTVKPSESGCKLVLKHPVR